MNQFRRTLEEADKLESVSSMRKEFWQTDELKKEKFHRSPIKSCIIYGKNNHPSS